VDRDINPDINLSMLNEYKLRLSWGIICLDDCFCKNENTRRLIAEAKPLCDQLRRRSSTINARVEAGVKLLQIYELLGISWVQTDSILYELWEMEESQPNQQLHSRNSQFCVKGVKIRKITRPFEVMDPTFDEFLKCHDTEDK